MLSAPNAIPLAPSPLSPNSSAAPPPRKIFFPPSLPPSKPTPRSAKSPTPSAASSANIRNPSSSNVERGSLAPAFLLSLLRHTFFRTCTSLQHLLKSPASLAGPRHRLSPRLRCSILSRINRWRPEIQFGPQNLMQHGLYIVERRASSFSRRTWTFFCFLSTLNFQLSIVNPGKSRGSPA